MPTGNPLIQQRLDDLIGEGERQWEEFTTAGKKIIQNPIRLTQWVTSCLNLLDKLSISSNRFVKEFERWVTPSQSRDLNIGAALGAALEESLKTRARALGLEVGPKDTLSPIITKLKAPDIQVLNEFEAKRLESVARMRNDAAHGGDFTYQADQVSQALSEVRATLEQVLKRR